jgi:hypothetical protein
MVFLLVVLVCIVLYNRHIENKRKIEWFRQDPTVQKYKDNLTAFHTDGVLIKPVCVEGKVIVTTINHSEGCFDTTVYGDKDNTLSPLKTLKSNHFEVTLRNCIVLEIMIKKSLI